MCGKVRGEVPGRVPAGEGGRRWWLIMAVGRRQDVGPQSVGVGVCGSKPYNVHEV